MAALVLTIGLLLGARVAGEPVCPGRVYVHGLGFVSLIPAGWKDKSRTEDVAAKVTVKDGKRIVAEMDGRGYFGSTCTAGAYNNEQYVALDLRGKTFKYTTDLSLAGCGCSARLSLTSMRQNSNPTECGDHYCDANKICGEACAEIDLQEGNRYAWHSTVHGTDDRWGLGLGFGGGGFGWSGPRNWKKGQFGPGGTCIDTMKPFEVLIDFPVHEDGSLRGLEINLAQHGKNGEGCPLSLKIDDYPNMAELDGALAKGMTPVVRYWSSAYMLWMDGPGLDKQGPCEKDLPEQCGKSVAFYDFSVTPALPSVTPGPAETTTLNPKEAAHRAWVISNVVVPFVLGACAVIAVQMIGVLSVWAARRFQGSNPEPAYCF